MAASDLPSITAEAPEDRLDLIRARMAARVNVGVDPGSRAFTDAAPGSLVGDLAGTVALEAEEAIDVADLVIRAIIPSTSYGEYLDAWAESLGLERKDPSAAGGVLRFAGQPGTQVPTGTQVTSAAPADGSDPPAFQVLAGGTIDADGTMDLPARAVEVGEQGNVAADAVTLASAGVPGVTSVTNPEPMSGGSDVEEDDALRDRVELELSGEQGSGTPNDYKRWCLAHAGVGAVTVVRAGRGPGTVLVLLLDPKHNPAPPNVLQEVKDDLDPDDPGLRETAKAPIGHEVYVEAPTLALQSLAYRVRCAPGYSLDGASGTVNIGDEVLAAGVDYVNGLDVGDDVVIAKLITAVGSVRGVADVTDVQVNGQAGNVAVAADRVAYTDFAHTQVLAA